MQYYRASLDRNAKLITWLFGSLSVILPFTVFYSDVHSINGNKTLGLIIVGLLPVMFLLLYLTKPSGYSIDNANLYVMRPAGKIAISLISIEKATILSSAEMGGLIRTLGNGGIFGYTGIFQNSTIGKMNWYATRKDHYIVIHTSPGKNIVITPDDHTGLFERLVLHKQTSVYTLLY